MMLGKLRGGQLNVGLAETEGAARFHPRPLGARMPAKSTCPRAGSTLTYSSKMQPLRDQEPIRTRAWNEARPDSRLFVFATRATGELTELCRTLACVGRGPLGIWHPIFEELLDVDNSLTVVGSAGRGDSSSIKAVSAAR